MSKGFTLIELMIVVVIIGVLAAISIPLYQIYVAKSQITAAISELNGAKPQYELIINNGSASGNADFTVPNMFFSGTQSQVCVYAVNVPDNTGNANQGLVCELQNVASVLSGEFVYLNRNEQGTWTCSTSNGVEAKFKPIDCV
ncbi:MAG: prepilin-type cleavage/methylation domain-containing protein [Acinetobacter johnsonii]|uniref:Prepilin-type cleavage/methylation domain-containing protein n=1 Tax=Acinetobacter johnsonii TaxID=40214 RepID=A0A2W5TIN1_ACIJO|nr:MAG: prepilin-type cleavage/methylation domain-containing protein [Acinetobacter johnsonii]